jgi:hypothetical protein
MFLAACTPTGTLSPGQATGTAEVVLKETAAMQLTLTPVTVVPTQDLPTPEIFWTPMPGEITAADSGSTTTISITSRISVILNGYDYPKENLSILCSPSDALGSISNIPTVPPPYYAVRFEAVAAGECNIQNGNFFVIIKVTANP